MMGLDLLTEVEVSIDYLYDKKYNDIPREVFDKVLDADPKYNGKQPSNYTQWMINLIRKNELKSEDIYKVKEYLPLLIQNKSRIEKKDINQIKSVQDLYMSVKKFLENPGENQSNSQVEKEIKKGAKKVYEDEEWIIIVPETKEASCYYGKGTQWCTAATKNNYEHNMFDHYSKYGPLYININKESGRKYQMNFPEGNSGETIQIRDETDSSLNGNVIVKMKMTEGMVKFYQDAIGWVVKIVFEDFYEDMDFPEINGEGFYEFGNFKYTPDNGEMIDYYNLGNHYSIENGNVLFDGQVFAKCPIKYESPRELEEKDIRLYTDGDVYSIFNFEGGNEFIVKNETGEIMKDYEFIDHSTTGNVFRRGNEIVNVDDEVLFTLIGKWTRLPRGSIRSFKLLVGGRFVMLTLKGNERVDFDSQTGEQVDLVSLGSDHYYVDGYAVNMFNGDNVAKLPPSFDGVKEKFLYAGKGYYVLDGKAYNKEGEEVSREELKARRQ